MVAMLDKGMTLPLDGTEQDTVSFDHAARFGIGILNL